MEAIVKEFEREYTGGDSCLHVRRFMNQYCIQGGAEARDQRKKEKQQKQEKARIQKKKQLIMLLLKRRLQESSQ